MSTKVLLPDDWLEHLGSEFEKPYMKDLKARLLADKKAGKKIYPPGPLIFGTNWSEATTITSEHL